MPTPAAPEPPRTVASIPDAVLVESAVRFAHFERPLGWRWVHVQTALGVGFDTAKNLCVRFGLDPDEEVGAETEAAREGGESDYEDNYEPVLEPVPPATLIADRDTASELRANVRDLERKVADQRDQLAAAGGIIAALVRQLDSYGAIVPHLPNVPPAQQTAATRMLAAVGLDCNGRRVHACVVPSPAPKESGGEGATAESRGPLSATPAIEPTGAADVLAAPKAGATPAELLAEVQAEMRECARLSECRRKEVIRRGDALARMEKAISAAEADRDYERQRANEAIAQLYDAREAAKQVRAAIFAALGVEPDDTSTLRLLVTVRHHIQTLRGDFRRVEEESREAVHLLQLLGVPVGTLPDMIAALLPKSRLMKLRIRNETEAALAIDNLSLQEVAEDDPRMVEAIRLHQQATALRRAAEPVRDHLPDAGKMVNA